MRYDILNKVSGWLKCLLPFLFPVFPLSAQTLEECQRAAEQNYPLIRQYNLIENTTDLTVANIQKGWLPQISASAQATYQSDVVSFPNEMQAMYQKMGISQYTERAKAQAGK